MERGSSLFMPLGLFLESSPQHVSECLYTQSLLYGAVRSRYWTWVKVPISVLEKKNLGLLNKEAIPSLQTTSQNLFFLGTVSAVNSSALCVLHNSSLPTRNSTFVVKQCESSFVLEHERIKQLPLDPPLDMESLLEKELSGHPAELVNCRLIRNETDKPLEAILVTEKDGLLDFSPSTTLSQNQLADFPLPMSFGSRSYLFLCSTETPQYMELPSAVLELQKSVVALAKTVKPYFLFLINEKLKKEVESPLTTFEKARSYIKQFSSEKIQYTFNPDNREWKKTSVLSGNRFLSKPHEEQVNSCISLVDKVQKFPENLSYSDVLENLNHLPKRIQPPFASKRFSYEPEGTLAETMFNNFQSANKGLLTFIEKITHLGVVIDTLNLSREDPLEEPSNATPTERAPMETTSSSSNKKPLDTQTKPYTPSQETPLKSSATNKTSPVQRGWIPSYLQPVYSIAKFLFEKIGELWASLRRLAVG